MASELLSVKDISKLFCCSERTVRWRIQKNKIKYIVVEGSVGKGGKQYLIPLEALEEKYQIKWRAKQKQEVEEVENIHSDLEDLENDGADPRTEYPVTIEECSAQEREEITRIRNCLQEWRRYRGSYQGKKGEADPMFVASWNNRNHGMSVTVKTLYRKWKNYQQYGDVGLLDKRGKALKGKTSIDPVIWTVFEDYYLDENQRSITFCRELTEMWTKIKRPELLPLPAYNSFYRATQNIPFAVLKYFRGGQKAFEDDAMPYVIRIYEGMQSNEYWVGDNHTLDIISRVDGKETNHRLYVTVFQDIRSRKWVGWYVTESPCADATLMALRKGIERYGIPQNLYVDNGREFLVSDIGGRGHRKRKSTKPEDEILNPILDRLGIKMVNAIVKNAKAKIVERAFKEFSTTFSKLFNTYTGSNPVKKPGKLKVEIKNGNITLDSDIREHIDNFIDGYYNERSQKGSGMNNKTPNQVYAENLIVKRTASKEDLNLMLMRVVKAQTVRENGVTLNLYGQKLPYGDNDFNFKWQGKKVFVRYNPEDLREVRVYDETDAFITTLPVRSELILKYGADKDDIKQAQKAIRGYKKAVKGYKDNRDIEIYDKMDAVEVVMMHAKENIKNAAPINAKIIEMVRADEEVVAARAVGHADEFEGIVDLNKMYENARKNRGL